MAAEQGHSDSQSILGEMYAEGFGELQDFTHAHMWFDIAVSTGNKKARRSRDKVEKKMTPAQIEKARDLARQCVAKNYKDC